MSEKRTKGGRVEVGARSPIVAAVLAWVVPGLGHWYLGEKRRAIILFVVLTTTFWGGVAVGGVRSTVTPRENGAWIAAQLCAGSNAIVALGFHSVAVRNHGDEFKAPWPASTISVVYAGITGLLNLLVILDALARSEPQAREALARGPPGRDGT